MKFRKDFLLALLLFAVVWLVMNNSYLISRDELWYTSYATALNDAETSDIRHITELDLHQVAYPVVFRWMQRVSIAIFGQNIFGLRALNLLFGLLMIAAAAWAFQKLAVQRWWLFGFTGIMLFEPYMANYAHHMRPDWIFICCTVITAVLLAVFIGDRKDRYLFSAGVIAAFSTGIYWNGLAIVAALGMVLLFLLIKKVISFKTFLTGSVASGIVIVIVFLLPLLYFLPEAKAVFQNEALQSSRLFSGSTFVQYPRVVLEMLTEALVLGKYQAILGGVFFLNLVGSFLLIRSKQINSRRRLIIQTLLLYFTVALLIVALRSAGARSVHFFTGVMVMWFLIGLSFLWQSDYRILHIPLAKGFSLYLILFLLSITCLTSKTAWVNRGQWQAYTQYSADVRNIISEGQGKVLTTFDFSWALDSYDKFFLEATSFQKPQSYAEVKSIFDTYDVQYMLVNERTRLRMQGRDEYQENYAWYLYWNQILLEEYEQIGAVYNKYYRYNKGVPPQDSRGFMTEIWRKG